MAISTKGRRKVNYKGQKFIWYVNEIDKVVPDEGFVEQTLTERYLHIISTNKKFIVHYRMPKSGDEDTLLEIEGPRFPRAPEAKEVRVPRWKHDSKRYPTNDFVRRLIHWCMDASAE